MSLLTKINEIVNRFGDDAGGVIKSIGDLSTLSTTQKMSIVLSLNEIESDIDSLVANASVYIDDSVQSNEFAYSSTKILSLLNTLKTEILDGVGSGTDTLAEIETLLLANNSAMANLLASLGEKVSFTEAQNLDETAQQIAQLNLGIASANINQEETYLIASDVNTIVTPGYVRPGYFQID